MCTPLVCFAPWDPPNCSASCCALVTLGTKLSISKGALNWFHNVLSYNGGAIEYWTMFFLLKIYLNPMEELLNIEQFFLIENLYKSNGGAIEYWTMFFYWNFI
jgi:hypothetical protein